MVKPWYSDEKESDGNTMSSYDYNPALPKPSGLPINTLDLDNRIVLNPLDIVVKWQAKNVMDGPIDDRLTLALTKMKCEDGKTIPIYWLWPKKWKNQRIMLHCHGGGFLLPIHEAVIKIASVFAIKMDMLVVIPDYRTAIHHPYPTSLRDCMNTYTFLNDHFDLTNFMLYGDSAGGCLAAQLNRLLHDYGLTMPKATMLTYPVSDDGMDYESMEAYKNAEIWSKNANESMWKVLLDGATKDKYTIPLRFHSFEGFGPTWIDVAQMDVLHDQGLALADKIRQGDNVVETLDVEGAYHAYDSNTGNGFVRSIYDKRIQWLNQYMD